MVIARGSDPARNVRAAVARLGGMPAFVDRADVVVVKPNIGWERTAEQGANTHPEVVRLCREAGARRVVVSDCPVRRSRAAFERSGILAAAAAAGADVVLPEDTFPRPLSQAFFVSLTGTRLHYPNVQVVFYRLVGTAGLAHRNLRRPRIHDLRHAFAVHTLLDWYRTGVDAEARLPWLSTYLGHVSLVYTYWYLTVTPELATLAHRRLEHFLETRS
jgi:integrase